MEFKRIKYRHDRRSVRILMFLILFGAGVVFYKIVLLQFFSHLMNAEIVDFAPNPQASELRPAVLPFTGERLVHLDLKGAPPSITYLRELFPLLASLNATGLLIEYEDTFPYSLTSIRADNTYTKEDIRIILKLANTNRLKVIPLVQTFGHLEFLLKTKKYAYLREHQRYPQTICPTNNDTIKILTSMLDEVIATHVGIRYIHIGCDEVHQLGVCDKCVTRINVNRWHVKQLFLQHVATIASYIREKYPHITPLMWDDELRSVSYEDLSIFKIGSLVEPVIWSYKSSLKFPNKLWKKYAQVFPVVWVASSFKGATGPATLVPNINFHLSNHKAWVQIMSELSGLITFKGIVLTGWQRFDHFAVLCELLPVGIPSLVNNMLYLDGLSIDSVKAEKKLRDIISCGKDFKSSMSCKFPGVKLYNAMVSFARLRDEIDTVMESGNVKGWLTTFNLERGYFNPLLVEELAYKVNDCKNNINRLNKTIVDELRSMYDGYTVLEWTETYLKPYYGKLDRLGKIVRYVSTITEWSSRPLQAFVH